MVWRWADVGRKTQIEGWTSVGFGLVSSDLLLLLQRSQSSFAWASSRVGVEEGLQLGRVVGHHPGGPQVKGPLVFMVFVEHPDVDLKEKAGSGLTFSRKLPTPISNLRCDPG